MFCPAFGENTAFLMAYATEIEECCLTFKIRRSWIVDQFRNWCISIWKHTHVESLLQGVSKVLLMSSSRSTFTRAQLAHASHSFGNDVSDGMASELNHQHKYNHFFVAWDFLVPWNSCKSIRWNILLNHISSPFLCGSSPLLCPMSLVN